MLTMMTVPPPIIFRVVGEPKPQPRPRAFARKFGNVAQARVYNPSTAEGWKSQIAEAAKPILPRQPLTGPLRVNITWLFPRPKYHFNSLGVLKPTAPHYHITKPDRDNLEKAVLDALTTIGFWEDDCQVCDGIPCKLYVRQVEGVMERPGAIITVVQIPAPVYIPPGEEPLSPQLL